MHMRAREPVRVNADMFDAHGKIPLYARVQESRATAYLHLLTDLLGNALAIDNIVGRHFFFPLSD